MEIDNKRCIFLDTETTGKSDNGPSHIGHRVIDIGAVEVINRKVTGNNFQHYLNPGMEVSEDAIKVHGITNEFLADKPKFSQIADDFINYIKGAVLIIHNAKFDVGFLNQELALNGRSDVKIEEICEVVDSYTEAKELLPGHAKYSLDALSKFYEIEDNYDRSFHGALLDSQILADVYLAMTGGQHTLDFSSTANYGSDFDESLGLKSKISNKGLFVLKANDEETEQHVKKLHSLNKSKTSTWETYYNN